MEAIFLDSRTLGVKDHASVSSYSIVIDNVVPQASSFTVNKESVSAAVGDYIALRGTKANYIGIVSSIEADEDGHVTDVKSKDFISILDVEVRLKSFSGNMSVYLLNLIRSAFVVNSDPLQNLPFLTVSRDDETANGALTFEADEVGSISGVVSTLNKAYGLGISYSLVTEDGRISAIDLRITKCRKGLVLRHDAGCISNLKVSESNSQSVNKVTFYPEEANEEHRTTESFYLLSDGTVTQDSGDGKRLLPVSVSAKTYSDDDYSSLSTTAQSELLSSSLEHSITFDLLMENGVASLFSDLEVGDFVEFMAPGKTYQTMVTKVTIKDSAYTASVTLGEYRVSLTEKIKLLSRKRGGN